MSSHLCDFKQTADFLGVSVNTLIQMYKKWGVPHYKVGRNIRFDVRMVMAWLEATTEEGKEQ